jgi:hypothetical protein
MTLLIDTAGVPARERVEFWSESSCRSYHPVQIRSGADGLFWARMWAHELGPLSVYRIVAAANTMIRTSRSIAAGDPECLHLEVILRGQMNAAQEGRTGIAVAGDIISYETSHPALFRADAPFESVIVRVHSNLLGTQAEQITGMTAVQISGRHGLPRAAASSAASPRSSMRKPSRLPTYRRRSPVFSTSCAGCMDLAVRTARRSCARVRRSCSASNRSSRRISGSRASIPRRSRARASSRRDICTSSSSEGRPRQFFVQFLEDGGPVQEPGEAIVSSLLAEGLPGAQHFSRVFRAEYGCSPNEFRREALRAAAAG